MEKSEYIDYRNKLNTIYEKKINGIRISTNEIDTNMVKILQKFLFKNLILKNLELRKAKLEILQKMKKALHVIKELIKSFLTFMKTYFQKILTCSKTKLQFLNLLSIPQLVEDQARDCEFILSEKDLLLVLKSMLNNKLPSNDGLTKEFFEVFWGS